MQHPIFALGIPHGSEWLIILVLAVLFFGADKLPKLARGLGKSLGEFKKAKEDFEKEIHNAAAASDTKTETPKVSGNLPEPIHPLPASSTASDSSTSADELTRKS
jgi:TatA/E family protein of Tat protein translocase